MSFINTVSNLYEGAAKRESGECKPLYRAIRNTIIEGQHSALSQHTLTDSKRWRHSSQKDWFLFDSNGLYMMGTLRQSDDCGTRQSLTYTPVHMYTCTPAHVEEGRFPRQILYFPWRPNHRRPLYMSLEPLRRSSPPPLIASRQERVTRPRFPPKHYYGSPAAYSLSASHTKRRRAASTIAPSGTSSNTDA